jgi:hypothetical protein
VDGKEDWIRCETESTMILPPNSLHALYNRSSEACRVLGISTLHHTFFDVVASADQKEPFSAVPLPEAMARMAQIGLRHSYVLHSVRRERRAKVTNERELRREVAKNRNFKALPWPLVDTPWAPHPRHV